MKNSKTTDESRNIHQEYATKIFMTIIFFIILIVFLWWLRYSGIEVETNQLGAFEIALIGLATLRLGRLVAYSKVIEPIRAFFTVTIPDESGAGETVVPRGKGVRNAIGQFISCPICVGTWCAAILVYGMFIAPSLTIIFLYMTAGIGIAEILNALVEALSWSGQSSRTRTGERRNNK
jgi:hypothetical protein